MYTISPSHSYSVLANSRVVIVAIIYYFGLKREITRDQWMAVVLLVIAVTLAQLKDDFQLHVSLYWLMAGVFLVSMNDDDVVVSR